MLRAVADAFNRIAENGGGANIGLIGKRSASADGRPNFGAPEEGSSLSPPEFLAAGDEGHCKRRTLTRILTYDCEWYGRLWEEDEEEMECVWRGVRMDEDGQRSGGGGLSGVLLGLAIRLFGAARCQLDLRLTIPGAARVVDLRACTPITHSRR